ncbi:hypothetical protein FOZ60_014165 [Perkinsus olseni]|uniref:Uncharacterized protein n=1 Tax=Perkinsus olseni TaxID=32597 RepID=A0A7J6N840_PEROL|nr:hypothetical protein FOZ60_014165 [Perkinsus olseni]
MPTSLFYSTFATLTLHLVEGILNGSPTRDPPVTPKAVGTGPEQHATKYVANFYDERSEVDKEHCAVGCDAEGRVNYIVRDLTNSTYGFFLDVSMDAPITRLFKGVENGFSIGAQNATEKKNLTDRVSPLKRHLMREIGGTPPWEEEMLLRMKEGKQNLAGHPSALPFPSPSRSKLKFFSSSATEDGRHWRSHSHGCEDMRLEFLHRYFSNTSFYFGRHLHQKAQFVQWVTSCNLHGEMELKFDEDRLRELEEGADQVVPDPTRLSDKPYMVEMCDKRLGNYVKYIAQKDGVSEADLVSHEVFRTLYNDNRSAGVVMWLLTGKSLKTSGGTLVLSGTPQYSASLHGT